MGRYTTASVVPLRRLPPHLSEFTYRVPESLISQVAVGSVVRVSFKQSLIHGVVVSLNSEYEAPQPLKDIVAVSSVAMTSTQLAIAMYLSELYAQSLGVIFNSMVSEPPVHLKPFGGQSAGSIGRKTKTLKRPAQDSVYLLYEQPTTVYSYLVSHLHAWQRDGQTLLIAPERKIRDDLYSTAKKADVNHILLIPDKQHKNEFAQAWQQSVEAPVMVGGMLALLLPFGDLRRIVIVEAEHQQFHRAEQNPRYHLADIIWHIAERYGADVFFSGFSPNIRLLYQCLQKNYPIKQLTSSTSTAVRVIDLQHEKESGNYGILSEPAKELIERTKGRVLLYYNRHGYARLTVCTDCGFTARCERCERPLMLDASGSKLQCGNCGFMRPVYLECPRCHSTALRSKGKGVDRIVADLKKLFPGLSVTAFSSTSHAGDRGEIKSDIVVATAAILSQRAFTFDVGIMLNADLDLHVPNYHAAEALRHTIGVLRSMVRELLVQTFDPAHYVFTTFATVDRFYREELKWRKALLYPPFATILKVWVREKDPTLYARLRDQMLSYFKQVPMTGPFERREGTAHIATLICKLQQGDGPALDLLKRAPYTWMHAEINPYQLF